MAIVRTSKPLPRKFMIVARLDGRYDIMCEIRDRTYTAEVPEHVGRAFLEKVWDWYMALIVQHGIVTPRIRERRKT